MHAQTAFQETDARRILELAEDFEARPTGEVMAWAVERFGDGLTQACSFGLEDVALVEMHAELTRRPDIFYLDTGFLFPETIETRDRLGERYGIEFRQILPSLSVQEQEEVFGKELYRRVPSQCCWLRKVEPLKRALSGYEAWITGVRRDQAPTRASTAIVEWDEKFDLWKINPLAAWTFEEVKAFVDERGVPKNPLHERGYPSIGCMPCTSAVSPGEDPRSGRWRGFAKVECGLHPVNGGTR